MRRLKEIITYRNILALLLHASEMASQRNILQPCVICHQCSLLHLSPCHSAVHNRPWLKGECSCEEKSASHYKILHTSPSSLCLTFFLKSSTCHLSKIILFLKPVFSHLLILTYWLHVAEMHVLPPGQHIF